MKATRIKMKIGCAQSNNTTQISEIYVEGCTNPGYFTKESLYDYLKKNPDSIQVNIYPYPNLIPALSSNQEKYVRSEPNDTPNDNLLKLPRNYSILSNIYIKHVDERCHLRVCNFYNKFLNHLQ